MSFSAAAPRCLARVAQQQVHQRHASASVLQQLFSHSVLQQQPEGDAAAARVLNGTALQAGGRPHELEERASSSRACSTSSNGAASASSALRALRDSRQWSVALHGEQRRALFGLSSAPPQSKKFSQRRLVGWTSDQLYAVVSDVDQYSKFVPWCQRSVVTKRAGNSGYLEAELEVGFQVLVERYVSQVTLHPGKRVESKVQDSMLFDHLDSTWSMEPGPAPNTCWLTFQVDFAFNNALYGHLADVFFSEVVQRMVSAFESRCHQLYGASSLIRPAASTSSRPGASPASSPASHQHQHQQRQACSPARAGGHLQPAAAGGSAQRVVTQHPHHHRQQQQQQQAEQHRAHRGPHHHAADGSDAAVAGGVQPARGS